MTRSYIDLQQLFETASGSIIGAEHRRQDKNNQDAYGLIESAQMLIAVVCDGASKGFQTPFGDWTHSEVGAQLSMRWMLDILQTYCWKFLQRPHKLSEERPFPYWEDVRQELMNRIFETAVGMDGNTVERIVDYFLSTVVGALVTPYGVCIFSLGDGMYVLNGEVHNLGPFPENKPPYPAYGITGSDATDSREYLLRFKTQYVPLEELQSLLIGTDGFLQLVELEESPMPGSQQQVGPVSQFWTDNTYFTNPIALGRKLSLINRHAVQIDRENIRLLSNPGLLDDDTTCVVIRRRQEA